MSCFAYVSLSVAFRAEMFLSGQPEPVSFSLNLGDRTLDSSVVQKTTIYLSNWISSQTKSLTRCVKLLRHGTFVFTTGSNFFISPH